MFNKELRDGAELVAGFLEESSEEGQYWVNLVKLINMLKKYRRHPDSKLKSEINHLLPPFRYRQILGEKPPLLKLDCDPEELEGLLTYNILMLYRADALDRLRPCKREGCGKWLMAWRSDKKYCPGCSQRIYRKKKLKQEPGYFARKMDEWRHREGLARADRKPYADTVLTRKRTRHTAGLSLSLKP